MFVCRGRSINRVSGKTEEWELDLSALAFGSHSKSKGFRGRPALARRIIEAFQKLHQSGSCRSTAIKGRSNLHNFWRFLDEMEELSRTLDGTSPVEIDDLDWAELEAIWRTFVNWLKAHPGLGHQSRRYINWTVCSVFLAAHDMALEAGQTDKQYLDVYVHFKDSQSSSYGGDPLDYEEAKRAFAILSQYWHAALRRVADGWLLVARGEDPRMGSSGRHRWDGGSWDILENRLWLLANTLPFGKLARDDDTKRRVEGYRLRCLPESLRPKYLSDTGMWAHVPAVFFTYREIAVAFAMVCMKTGMNVDALARMRVDSWFRRDPIHPDERVILYGPKRILGKVQKASSSIRKNTDAYKIILKVIEVMAPLRERAREVAAATGDVKLAQKAELIWVWPTPMGLATLLPESNKGEMHAFLDELFTVHHVKRDNGDELRFRFSMGRDIWGLFVYQKSGFNHLLTAQALGHSTLRSLLHYVEKRSAKRNDRKRLIDLQGRVLADLKLAEYDPRSYREPLPGFRASTGLQCTDPTHPTEGGDPGNTGGRTCRTQNCWACFNWYAVVESLPYLIRMTIDLREIRETLSVALWEASDYPEMLVVYEHIVSKFHAEHVARAEASAVAMAPIIPTTWLTTSARTFRQ